MPTPASETPHVALIGLPLQAILGEHGGDSAAVERALECAMYLAEHGHLLQRPTAHGNLLAEILGLVAGTNGSSSQHGSEALREPLTESETRVLGYLPTDLSKQEIANELYVSVNTVKTHVKHVYAKLEARTRRQAIARARELGLLKRALSSSSAATQPPAAGLGQEIESTGLYGCVNGFG